MKYIVIHLAGAIPQYRYPVYFTQSRFPCADLVSECNATRFDSIQAATERAAQHWTAEQFTIEQVSNQKI